MKFSYDPDLVELLKKTVPGWARSWEPTTTEWSATVEFAEGDVDRRAARSTVLETMIGTFQVQLGALGYRLRPDHRVQH